MKGMKDTKLEVTTRDASNVIGSLSRAIGRIDSEIGRCRRLRRMPQVIAMVLSIRVLGELTAVVADVLR